MRNYNVVNNLQDENKRLNKNLTELKNDLQKVQQERDDWFYCAKYFITLSAQGLHQQECGGISKTYTSEKEVFDWYTKNTKSTMEFLEGQHQNTIKKIRAEMKTEVEKVEKENKLLQENYNQLKDKLNVLSDVSAEQLKVSHQNTIKNFVMRWKPK